MGILLFVAFVGFTITCLLAWAVIKAGSIKSAKAHFKDAESLKDWGSALSVIAVIVIILGLLSSNAGAEEPEYFQYIELYAGIDYVDNEDNSPQCVDGGLDDRITSNLGIRVHVITWHNWQVHGKYTHHSCAINRDFHGYDGYGVETSIRFNNPIGVLF